MIWSLAIWFASLVIKLALDVKLYHSRKVNRHSLGPTIVVIALSGASYLSGWQSAPMWFFGFWACFDPLYAILIGQKAGYLGTTAKLDRLQNHYPIIKVLKYLLAIASIIYYVAYITKSH